MSLDFLPELESVRDWVIIIYGAVGILFFALLSIFLLILVRQMRAIRRGISTLVDENIRPTLNEAHRTAENVRGTSEFISDAAVHPLIRAVAVARGVRRGLSALASVRPSRR